MEHKTASPATRGTDLVIQWSLLSIPVTVTKAVNPIKTVPARSNFTIDGNPIGSQSYDKVTGEKYDGDKVSMAQLPDKTWVPLSNDEVDALIADETLGKGVAEIVSILPVEAIGREYHVSSVDHIRPAKRKDGKTKVDDPAAIKSFSLLIEALASKNACALIHYSGYRGVVKPAAIMPDGRFVELAYAAEVRPDPVLPEVEHSPQELAMAIQLLDSMGTDTPKLDNKIQVKIADFVVAKGAGESVTVEAVTVKEPVEVVDLSSLLAASLETVS